MTFADHVSGFTISGGVLEEGNFLATICEPAHLDLESTAGHFSRPDDQLLQSISVSERAHRLLFDPATIFDNGAQAKSLPIPAPICSDCASATKSGVSIEQRAFIDISSGARQRRRVSCRPWPKHGFVMNVDRKVKGYLHPQKPMS